MSENPIITLSESTIEVIPGKTTEIQATIKNASGNFDSYAITVGGIDPGWYTLSFTNVSLSAGQSSKFTLTIKPPLISSGEAKSYKVHLRVTSTRDSSVQTTVIIEMPVGSSLNYDLLLTPAKPKRHQGSFTLNITNNGDKPVNYSIEGKDPLNACRFQIKQKSIHVNPGDTAQISLSVEPKDRPFRGNVEVYKFKIIVTPYGSLPYQSKNVSGELTYKPILKTIPTFLSIVSIIIVASTIGWISSIIGDSISGPTTNYTLTMNMYGNGMLSGYGIHGGGTKVAIAAIPEAKWVFVEWTGDIETVANPRSIRTSIIMDGDYTVTANFKLREFTPYTIYNITFNPQWPALLNYGDWVTIKFDYTVEFWYLSDSGRAIDILPDVNVIARPFSNGSLAPGNVVLGSNFLHPTDKAGKMEFTINVPADQVDLGQVIVDQIRFQITNADKSIVIHEFFVPAKFNFQYLES
jgi:hypothetical protein